MGLRLELKQTAGPGSDSGKRRWSFERGRRTIGRSSDCDWQLDDPKRAISKLHCTIVADRTGFELRDESANGSTIDGRVVHEGQTARLAEGSQLKFGEYAFEVSILGEQEAEFGDPDADIRLGDDNLTISSILSDVAPAADRSHGLRGSSDAWRDMPLRDAKTPSSRQVDIGWDGPPRPDAVTATLPDNWYDDSDYGNELEHGTAMHISVPHVRNKQAEIPVEVEVASPAADLHPAETVAAAPRAEDNIVAPAAPNPIDDRTLSRLEALIARCEDVCADTFASFDIEMADVLAGHRGPSVPGGRTLHERLETVLAAQLALKSSLDSLIGEATRKLEPRIIETRVDGERGALPNLPLLRDRSYWQAYRAQFEKDGSSLSVRDFLRDAMLRSVDPDAPDEDGVGPQR